MRILFFILLSAVPTLAGASTLFRCTDEFGHTTYTNYATGKRKCTVMSRDDMPTRSSTKSVTSSGAQTGATKTPTPADFPKVALETQKTRDGDRRFILEQEVEAEKKHLNEAQKTLADKVSAKSPADQTQAVRDRIALHERNLDALRREISNLK